MSIISDIEKVLDKAEKLNPQLNSFLSIEREHALVRAAALDSGRETKLNGLAIAVKDNICTKGMRTSCGSHILHNYKAHYDATAIARLNAAGAVLVGKTNMDEFAMGSSNESSAFGVVKNPWDVTRVPGGSFRSCGRFRSRSRRLRFGNRRFGTPAGVPLRRRRLQTDLRPHLALRPRCVCVVTG